jgi:nucleoside-diphosphate-sugar epimerase
VAREKASMLVYASSAAVYGDDPGRPLSEEEGLRPHTLYGVFTRADEEMARIYAQDYEARSAGFRPFMVYGPGRDVGVTSDITVVLEHAAHGQAFRIRFGGRVLLQHAANAPRALIAAALRPLDGSRVYNLRGTFDEVGEIVPVIDDATGTSGLVTHAFVLMSAAAPACSS